jgi:predicted RND superfamily exporter protein
MFSPTYISAAVAVIVNILSLLGINVGTEELTTTVTTIITIGAGLVVIYRSIAQGKTDIFGRRS